MAQGITDGLIQSIMTSDIFALKEQQLPHLARRIGT